MFETLLDSPATVTCTPTDRVGRQSKAGTTMLSAVDVASVTRAVTPSTRTVFSPTFVLNPAPVMLAGCPSIKGLGLTDANRTGGAVTTLRVASPVTPSAVADTVVTPGVPPVTSPFASTVAMERSAVAHVNVFPVNGLASAAWAVAVIWTLRAEITSVGSGVTATEATSVSTVIDSEPVCPSDVAVIVTGPGDRPVTLPLALTEATAASELLQVTLRPARALPAASSVLADICTLAPTTTVACAAVTVMLATGAGGGGSPPPGSLLLVQPRAKLIIKASEASPERAVIGISRGQRC